MLASPENGVGKTMLASLILGTLIDRYPDMGREVCPYQFWSVNSIRMRLKAAERFGGRETVEDVYRDFTTMWLLIIDDVGKEQLGAGVASDAFSSEMYFNIIDQRYNHQLPLIMTSNLDFHPWNDGETSLVDLMGRASVSRLVEMTDGDTVVIEGSDRR